MKWRAVRAGLAAVAAAVVLLSVGGAAWAETRAALVIGNQAYTSVTQLRNPVNDATDLAAALRGLGFQVELLTNAGLTDMERGVIRLKSLLAGSSDAVGFFFYAGHGVQSDGVNFLIPVDADILDEAFLKTKALAVQSVLDALQGARNALNVIVLDACRDNPFSWARSGTRGLTVVGQQPTGSIIAYATSANSKALDGSGRNGVFTAELLKNLASPGEEIQEVLRRTGAGVQAATSGAQTPAVYSQFFGRCYLAGVSTGGSAAPSAATPQPTVTVTVSKSYGSVQVDAKSAGDLYLDGVKQASLPAGASARLDSVETGGRTLEIRYGDGQSESRSVTVEKGGLANASFGYVPAKPAAAPAATTAATTTPSATSSIEMVLVDGGTFQMGSTSGDSDEKPVHSVTVSSFFLGKYEVTQKQWVAVMGSNPSNFKGDNLPVEQVSWLEAVDFCNRLSAKEGLQPCYTISGTNVTANWSANGYRLPTEAEWEYAARGGRSSRGYTYAGGNDAGAVGWNSANSGSATHAVGGKQANELGPYDMSGNVWEWCWDWYGSYGSGVQTDPRGPSSGQYRLLRGGSWSDLGSFLRSAYRGRYVPGYRFVTLGFRLARPRA